ncbi:hypothetical protein BGW80DRAFT_1250161 [Lactifluus volemus]|nr:hypothetical protein BGW80DRAFT_1250161 [Lactifluus volemus]
MQSQILLGLSIPPHAVSATPMQSQISLRLSISPHPVLQANKGPYLCNVLKATSRSPSGINENSQPQQPSMEHGNSKEDMDMEDVELNQLMPMLEQEKIKVLARMEVDKELEDDKEVREEDTATKGIGNVLGSQEVIESNSDLEFIELDVISGMSEDEEELS